MANRATKAEAEEVAQRLQVRFPRLELRIVDDSGVWADGEPYSRFGIYEVRHCTVCGVETLNADIGEIDRNPLCRQHEAEQEQRDDAASRRQAELAARDVAFAEMLNEYERN